MFGITTPDIAASMCCCSIVSLKPVYMQDNTIADSPMVELLTGMQHMLEQARVRSGGIGTSSALHQLVIIVADGRFHEKENLQRVVAVRVPCSCCCVLRVTSSSSSGAFAASRAHTMCTYVVWHVSCRIAVKLSRIA